MMSRTQPSYSGPPPRRAAWSGSRDDRMLAGVCAGVADHLGVDVTVVRILTLLGTLLGFGSLLVVATSCSGCCCPRS